MKFIPRRRTEQDSNGVTITYDYVTSEDIVTRHGPEFATQFEKFAVNLPRVSINNKTGYYYEDYKKIAYSTDMFLNNG